MDKLSIKWCLLCEIDDPYTFHYACLRTFDFQNDTDFDEAIENVSATAIVEDWLSVLLENRDCKIISDVTECIIPLS